jgi:hypothetical protein
MSVASSGWDRLFDLTVARILDWEVAQIKDDARNDELTFSDHAIDEGIEDGIDTDDMLDVIVRGDPFEKDLPGNEQERAPGIAFTYALWRHAETKVKVGESDQLDRYEVVTTHER